MTWVGCLGSGGPLSGKADTSLMASASRGPFLSSSSTKDALYLMRQADGFCLNWTKETERASRRAVIIFGNPALDRQGSVEVAQIHLGGQPRKTNTRRVLRPSALAVLGEWLMAGKFRCFRLG